MVNTRRCPRACLAMSNVISYSAVSYSDGNFADDAIEAIDREILFHRYVKPRQITSRDILIIPRITDESSFFSLIINSQAKFNVQASCIRQIKTLYYSLNLESSGNKRVTGLLFSSFHERAKIFDKISRRCWHCANVCNLVSYDVKPDEVCLIAEIYSWRYIYYWLARVPKEKTRKLRDYPRKV